MSDEVVETPVEVEVVETPVTEAPTEPTPPASPEPVAAKFGALAKREKELVQREKKLKDDAAALELRLASATSAEDLLKLAKEKPTEFFKRTGLTYQELTNAVLREDEPPTADDRVAKLEARLEAESKARAEAEEKAKTDAEARDKQANEHLISQFKATIETELKAAGETFELVNAEGAYDLVFDLIEEHYRRTEKVLPTEKAAELAENYLFEQATKKYGSSKKLAGLFKPPPPPIAAPSPVAAKKPAPSLTSKSAPAPASAPPEKGRLLSAREIADRFKKQRRATRNAGA